MFCQKGSLLISLPFSHSHKQMLIQPANIINYCKIVNKPIHGLCERVSMFTLACSSKQFVPKYSFTEQLAWLLSLFKSKYKTKDINVKFVCFAIKGL